VGITHHNLPQTRASLEWASVNTNSHELEPHLTGYQSTLQLCLPCIKMLGITLYSVVSYAKISSTFIATIFDFQHIFCWGPSKNIQVYFSFKWFQRNLILNIFPVGSLLSSSGSHLGFPINGVYLSHSRQVAHVYYQLFDSKMADGDQLWSVSGHLGTEHMRHLGTRYWTSRHWKFRYRIIKIIWLNLKTF
jgi:hypothetical protein